MRRSNSTTISLTSVALWVVLRPLGEPLDVSGPHRLEHGGEFPEGVVVGTIQTPLSVRSHRNSADIPEFGQVLRYSRARHVNTVGDHADWEFVLPDELQDLLTTGLGNDMKRIDALI